LPTSPEFVAFVLDLLAQVGPVQARAMFGGHGLYARGAMFGLLDDDELFLKTDERCRATFVAAGCRQWSFVSTVPLFGVIPGRRHALPPLVVFLEGDRAPTAAGLP
jgi:TfoX/Sxy family transcriptional regulator of competence genes